MLETVFSPAPAMRFAISRVRQNWSNRHPANGRTAISHLEL